MLEIFAYLTNTTPHNTHPTIQSINYASAIQNAPQNAVPNKALKFPQYPVRMGEKKYLCYLGKKGITTNKKEGDQATPAGDFGLKMVLFRSDRIPREVIKTKLPVRAIQPNDGWCDDPQHPQYNQPVKLPFPASHEKLWFDDHYYDLVIVTDYNMNPIIPGKGSAIFIHIKDRDTQGCLGFSQKDLLEIINQADRSTRIKITPGGNVLFYQAKIFHYFSDNTLNTPLIIASTVSSG